MDEPRLRRLAGRCRQLAATVGSQRTAETLQEMARAFEASASTSERLPLITARLVPKRGAPRRRG